MTKKINPAVKPAPKKQQEFVEDPAFYIDPHGQMTINKIDSPMGILCQTLIKAEMDIEKAKDDYADICYDVMKQMRDGGIKLIRVLGRTVVFQDAKLSEPKIIIKDQT